MITAKALKNRAGGVGDPAAFSRRRVHAVVSDFLCVQEKSFVAS